MKFTDLGLAPSLLKAIQEKGYTEPSPIQEKAIPQILQGKDVLASAQTGTGKTAGFTLPLLQLLSKQQKSGHRKVRALVLTPTRELAAQIYENGETGTSVSWQTLIYKNGSIFLRGAQTTDYAVGYTFPISAVVIPLAASDYIELYVLHNKGSNASINFDNTGTFLNVWRLK